MKNLNVSEELGVILLGLAVYDFTSTPWSGPIDIGVPEFGPVRWILTFLLLSSLVISLSITHRTNAMVASRRIIDAGNQSLDHMKRRPFEYLAPTFLVFVTLALSLTMFGSRTAFLVWSAIGFINIGPWIDTWMSPIGHRDGQG